MTPQGQQQLFTAQQVKDQADTCARPMYEMPTISAMLYVLADLLSQEEVSVGYAALQQAREDGRVEEAADWKRVVEVQSARIHELLEACSAKAYERLRAEGRLQVFEEIEAIEPMCSQEEASTFCHFCGEEQFVYLEPKHQSDCLWLRAKSAVAASPVREEPAR